MRAATFRQLQIFAMVSRHASYSRAAAALHLTQPAVSMQVRELARIAGLPLFEQSGRRLLLTDAGREMLRFAGAATDLQREARERLDALKGVRSGELRLSAVSTAKYFAPALLAEFNRLHPGITIRLTIGNREEIVAGLGNNDADLVIMGRPPRELATVAAPVAPHPLAIVAAPQHPLARARGLTLQRLASEPFLIREQGSGTRASMERVFAEHRASYRTAMEVSSNETIKQAVMAGMGLAFISLHTVGLELRARKLVVLDVAGLPIVRQWFLIYREGRQLAPAAAAFHAFLSAEGQALIQGAVDLPQIRRMPRRGGLAR